MDLSETPAVEPMDEGGDERVGLFLGGALLVALGWVFAVALNLILHSTAPTDGTLLGPVRIFRHMGTFAWATFGIGIMTGAIGVALALLGRATPGGPFVLPGQPY